MSQDDDLFAAVGELQERYWALEHEGRLDEAFVVCRAALQRLEDGGHGATPDAANLLADLADIEADRERLHSALQFADRAYAVLASDAKLAAASTWDPDLTQLWLRVLRGRGVLRRRSGDHRLAENDLRCALELARDRLGPDSLELAQCRNELGVLFKYAARFPEALELYELALPVVERLCGAESLDIAALLHNVGGVLHASGDYAGAESPGRKAWELSRALLGVDHPRAAADACAYAAILCGLGRLEESETLYRHGLAVAEAASTRGKAEVAGLLHDLAAVRDARSALAEAARLYGRALVLRDELFGADSIDSALTRNNLGELLTRMGDVPAALALLEQAQTVLGRRLTAGHPYVVRVTANLAAARAAS